MAKVGKSDYDRLLVDDDFKKRSVDWLNSEVPVPSTGVYDGTLKYYAANADWQEIIEGHIDLLAEIAAWKDASGDDYPAIREILIFLEGIDVPTFDCSDVEDCLESSTIINNINTDITNVEQSGSISGNPANVSKPIENGVNYGASTEEAFTPSTCDDSEKDKLWSAVSGLIDFIDDTNQDLFQIIGAYSNRAQLVASLISAIPLVGLLTFDDAINLAAKLADTVGVQYAANTTTIGLYQVKCDLFCAAVASGCHFSLDDVFSYFLANDGIVALSTSNTFQDNVDAIIASSGLTGMQWFCMISYFQLGLSALGETFVTPIPLLAYARAAQAGVYSPEGGWRAWCDACGGHTGAWTVVLDFSNDYVASGSEIVIRNAYNFLTQVSGTASTLSQQYGKGIVYTNLGSQGVVKDIAVSGGSCIDIQFNARKVSGTASSVGLLNTSNTYSGQPRRNFSSSSFAWSTAVPLFNVGGGAGAITRIRTDLNTTLASQTCVAEIRYMRITGTGAIPKFG